MESPDTTPFSGAAGQVLREALSAGTLLTAVGLASVTLAVGFACVSAGLDGAVVASGQLLVAMILARLALNGMSGERAGTILSTAGGSWARAAGAAARYLGLSALWLLPAAVLSSELRQAGADAVSALEVVGSGAVVSLVALCAVGIALAPPVFLIVSVRAASFGDLFLPSLWSRSFTGRLGELGLVYVFYLGALAALAALALPVAALGFAAGADVGLILLGCGLAFAWGVSAILLGRVCGLYAFEVEGTAPQEEADLLPPAPRSQAGPSAPTAAPPSRAPVPARAPTRAPLAPAAAAAAKGALKPAGGATPAAMGVSKPAARSATGAPAAKSAPTPQVLHALVLAHHKAGHDERALEVAREALPLCFQRGAVLLAAEIFRALWTHLAALPLSRDQVLAIGGALVKAGDLKFAASAFVQAFKMEPGELRAVKGLLQVADLDLRPGGSPDDAAKIYKFLLHSCPSSPFEQDIRMGLAETERRLARIP